MTKKEIVKTISEEIGMTQLKTKEIVQKTFDAIVRTLVEEGRIELRNFGVFEVKQRAARKARNPRTGDRVDVPEKFVVTFKPGKHMEERVRQLELKAAAEAAAARAAANAKPAPASNHQVSAAPRPSESAVSGLAAPSAAPAHNPSAPATSAPGPTAPSPSTSAPSNSTPAPSAPGSSSTDSFPTQQQYESNPRETTSQ